MKIGIIAGTGFEKEVKTEKEEVKNTPYGTVTVYTFTRAGREYFYIPRHDKDHSVAPHKINYRANASALKAAGVELCLSLCAVGSVRKELSPGSPVIIRDIIDRTWGRPSTFYDGEFLPLKHLDVSNVYNEVFQKKLRALTGFSSGVYVCTQGPRFETSAEIREYQLLGGDVVGMTNSPEIFLLSELGLRCGTIAYVTNYCTGVSSEGVTLSGSFQEIFGKILDALDIIGEMKIEEFGPPCSFF